MNAIFPIAAALFLSFAFSDSKGQFTQQGETGGMSNQDLVNESVRKSNEAAEQGRVKEAFEYRRRAEDIYDPYDDPVPPPRKNVIPPKQQSNPLSYGSGTGCKSQKLGSTQAKSCEDLFKTPKPKDKLPPSDDPSNYSQSSGSSKSSGGGER